MMVSTNNPIECPLERQRGKNRKFRGTTTVLTSILKIGSSRSRTDEMKMTSPPPTENNSVVPGRGRRQTIGGKRTSKSYNRFPDHQSSFTCSVFHPRIPPFPGSYLATMNTSMLSNSLHSIPSASSSHISLGPRSSPTGLHVNLLHIPQEQSFYMPTHSYLQQATLSNQPPMSYDMGPPTSPTQTNIEAYMYMKAYLRDPWSSDGFRLMILLPVGPREDGTYGILNPGVKPDQVYSLCFYYADSILYYSLPAEDGKICYIPA